MRPTSIGSGRKLAVLLIVVTGLGFSQIGSRKTLSVKGYPGQAPVVQINGKSYVDIESLARLTNGALTFQANQITLTLAVAPPAATPAPPPADPAAKLALSKDFLRAAVEDVGAIREWRVALLNAVRNSSVADDVVAVPARNAENQFILASAAAVKDSDHDVLPLLRNALNNMQKLSDKYLALRKSLTYIPPESVDSDPLDQQIRNCAAGLGSLAASGQFQDVPVCH